MINSNQQSFSYGDSLSHLISFFNDEKDRNSSHIRNHFLNLLPQENQVSFQYQSYNSPTSDQVDESNNDLLEKKENTQQQSNVKEENYLPQSSEPTTDSQVDNSEGASTPAFSQVEINHKFEETDSQPELTTSLLISLSISDLNFVPHQANSTDKIDTIENPSSETFLEPVSTPIESTNLSKETTELIQNKKEESNNVCSVSTAPPSLQDDFSFLINNFSREILRDYLISKKKIHNETTLIILERAFENYKQNVDFECFKTQIDQVQLDESFDEAMPNQ